MKARYLMFFSYIGTGFRSSEKIWLKEGKNYDDPDSIQGLIEIALLKLRSLQYPRVYLSSRTDGGVHALNSSAHFDLERKGETIFEPHFITYNLNRFFYRHNYSITIRNCIRVSDDFSARRHALSRKYLYRIAVLKNDVLLPENGNFSSYIPIEEWKRCYFINLPDFNIDKFKKAATYFPGYHDFSSFKRFDSLNVHKTNRRLLYSVKVQPGQPLVTSYSNSNIQHFFDYWDVEFHGKGFVHKQIRRILGAMISAAIGKLPIEEIKVMLQVPSKHSWPSYLQSAPPHGLYLCNVEYNPDHLLCDSNIDSKKNEEFLNEVEEEYE